MQIESSAELENRASIDLLEDIKDGKDGKVMVDHEPEKSDPINKPVTQEEDKDSNAECLSMELTHTATNKQRTMPHQIEDWMQHVHPAKGSKIMAS